MPNYKKTSFNKVGVFNQNARRYFETRKKRKNSKWVISYYQESKSNGNNDSGGNGDGSEIEVAKMASECLSYDSHGEHDNAAEDGGTRN